MTGPTHEHELDDPELKGLPMIIDKALQAHPGYTRGGDGIAACDGPGCDWRKTERTGTTRAWRKHQKYTLTAAVADWYLNP